MYFNINLARRIAECAALESREFQIVFAKNCITKVLQKHTSFPFGTLDDLKANGDCLPSMESYALVVQPESSNGIFTSLRIFAFVAEDADSQVNYLRSIGRKVYLIGWIRPVDAESRPLKEALRGFIEVLEEAAPLSSFFSEILAKAEYPLAGEARTPSDAEEVQLTIGQLRCLQKMLNEAREAVGRDIVHGDINDDSWNDIHENVMSTMTCKVINRWLMSVAPQLQLSFDLPDEGGYPDDDEEPFKEQYEFAGFAKN